MPSQILAILGVNSNEESISLDQCQIIDSLILLHCTRTPSPLSPPPVLMTCISEDRLRSFSRGTQNGLGHPFRLDYSEAIDIRTAKPATLAAEALYAISNIVPTIEERESLVIILCGHVGPEGNFFAGEDILTKGALEKFVDLCKGKVLVVSMSCYSGLWKSDSWELVAAAAAADEQSTSVLASAFDPFGGSIFVSALLAKHYSNSGVAMPSPGITTSIPAVEPVNDSIPEDDSLWTSSEEAEMKALSLSIKDQGLSTVASNLHTIQYALWFLAGGEKQAFIRSIPHKKPLVILRKHEALRERARVIAEARKLGKCDVSVVTPSKGQWQEPAYWLAKLWKAAGGTPVDERQWDEAVAAGAIVSA
ncbi:hypothetical protein ARMGADRAFT_1063007 [Armillaria gallica]|uniref:Peptidase C13 family protein n=1 Tax=Armillaria gallica TaxID=47427 RepID=A0A2H3DHP0_ARMGA|nr:hypothetical protein ARMGADRAFT_1063007 [Armillaria gallica]